MRSCGGSGELVPPRPHARRRSTVGSGLGTASAPRSPLTLATLLHPVMVESGFSQELICEWWVGSQPGSQWPVPHLGKQDNKHQNILWSFP